MGAIRRHKAVLATLLAVLGIAVGVPGIAAAQPADTTSPVIDYSFLSGIAPELANPGGTLPGANDPTCRPSAAHPNPVVLVHGTAGGAQTNWGAFVPLLRSEGYCPWTLTYGAYENLPWPISAIGAMGPMDVGAQQVSTLVNEALAVTGATKVDIVAHSLGTLVGNYYVKRLGGAAKVHTFVALAAPWVGNNIIGIGDIRYFAGKLGLADAFDKLAGTGCQSCGQVAPGSPFITALDADGIYSPDVTYTNIVTGVPPWERNRYRQSPPH
jgi:triacylglycerol lipase